MSPLKLALVWHMHQPWYAWPGDGEAALPFARLHAYGGYHDMPWLVRRFTGTRVTFNLTPSLMAQIVAYARGELTDRLLDLCRRPAADLSADEQTDLLRHFSAGHPDHIREVSPRYAQLSHKRGLPRNAEHLEAARRDFSRQELLDLQVWMNLACCGYALRHENETLRELWAKDRGFTEADKAALLDELAAVMGRLPAEYAAARREGRAELSASPYYHPILPLLCDMRDAVRRIPREDLPESLWQAPEEAERQLQRAREQHEAMFGEPPSGIWPSEGAVSDAVLMLLAEMGFVWTASDEEVLLKSLRPDAGNRPTPAELYRPYRAADTTLSIAFRDHHLSDRIGFVYRGWAPEDAAADLVGQLRRIGSAWQEANRPPLVCVILDGENPWGAYPDGGEGFLRALYAAIEADSAIETTSIGEYVREFPPTERLESVFPGSWIGHSYRTWIGGAEHRRAWTLVGRAREAVAEAPAGEARERAADYLMRAEGSDWYWWYSEFHHDEYEAVFDALFRANLAAVYSALGLPEPSALGEPISAVTLGWLARSPAGHMHACIDGRVTDYFEWQAAGLLRTSSLASAMHRSDCVVREIYFGFDNEGLYLRVDTVGRAAEVLQNGLLRFTFAGPPDHELMIAPVGGKEMARLEGTAASAAQGAVGTIAEMRVALDAIGTGLGEFLVLALSVESEDQVIERWPQQGFLRLEVPAADAGSASWLV